MAFGALFIALLSVVELFGAWFTSFDPLRTLVPGRAAIAPSSAACFVFIAAMIGSLRSRFFAEKVIFNVALLWATAICLVNLYLLVLGYPQGIDGLLGVVDDETAFMPMASTLSILVLLGILVAANYGGDNIYRIAKQIAIVGVVGASFALFTNLISDPTTMPDFLACMSVPSQIILLLSFSLLLFDLYVLTEGEPDQRMFGGPSLL